MLKMSVTVAKIWPQSVKNAVICSRIQINKIVVTLTIYLLQIQYVM